MSQQNIIASQMNRMLYASKIKAAQKGWDLLKKKNDSLKKKQ
jgi:vacuolar-type H+-ATPase subunit D/Vma8